MSQPRKASPQLDFDRLDTRCLLSGGVSASLSRGVLDIVGTNGPDMILVDVQRGAGRAQNRGVVNVIGVGQFPLGRVRRIEIAGLDGNDVIGLNDPGRRPLRAAIDGGAGNDIIVTNDFKASLNGSAGNDNVNGVWDQPPVAMPVMVASVPAPTPPAAPVPASTGLLSTLEQQIVDLTNQARVQAGLAPLRVNPQLAQAAQIHADDMARLDQMEHDLPGAALPTLEDRARYVGYSYSWLGENIAYNYPDANQVVSAWLASPGHRANMLNANFTEIGLGVATNGRGEPYYCQTFGSSF